MSDVFAAGYRELVTEARRNALTQREQVPTSFGEVHRASLDAFRAAGKSNSPLNARQELLEERGRKIAEALGEAQPPEWYSAEDWANPATRRAYETLKRKDEIGLDADGTLQLRTPRARQWGRTMRKGLEAMARVDALASRYPDLVLSDERLLDESKKRAKQRLAESRQVIQRGGVGGQVTGAMLGALEDPLILMTLPIGAGAIQGPSIAWNFARAFGAEAAVAGVVEVPIQASVKAYHDYLEEPYSWRDAAINVLGAAAGAGLVRGTGSVVVDVVQMRKAADALRAGGQNAQAEAVERYADLMDGAPFDTSSKEARTAHMDAAEKAAADVAQGHPAEVDEIVREHEPAAPGARPELIDPGELAVDAERFQFKADTDTAGVSDRLKGVEKWDPLLAGNVVVYEERTGARFIVDGHQRLALANRLIAEGRHQPGEIRMQGFVLREADGFTPSDARRMAAIKNIAEGTGTALDAAKVLREVGDGGLSQLPPLPPRSALVRDAQGLAKLGDEAFQAVINDVIDQRYAAVIGQELSDVKEQLAALKVLAQAEPTNVTQARLMVDQVKAAGFEREVTEDLFGEREVAESFYKERARVLDYGLRRLRQDRRTFQTLVEREQDIVLAGDNRLDSLANLERLSGDEAAMEQLSRLANTKGPISDALNDAARRLRAGESVNAAGREFLNAVRSEVGGKRAAAEALPTEAEPGKPVRLQELDQSQKAVAEKAFIAGQAGRSLDETYTVAGKWQGQLGRLGKTIEADLEGVEFKNPGVKKKEGANSAAEKIQRKGYTDASRLTDVVRGGFLVQLPEQADAVAERLAAKYAVLDEGWNVTDAGYFDRKLLVRFKDGTVAEVQVWHPKMLDAKEAQGGHALYEQARALETRGQPMPGKEAEHARLTEEMRALYGEVLASLDRKWANVASPRGVETMSPPNTSAASSSSPKAASNSSRETTRPESTTSDGDTQVQTPSSRMAAAARPSSSSTAGRASQDMNLDTLEKSIHPSSEDIIARSEDYLQEAERVLAERGEDFEVPVDVRLNDAGELEVVRRPAGEVLAEFDEEERMVDDLFSCFTGGGSDQVA